MAQYAIDPAVLAPYLPGGVELDLFGPERTCFVSLVGFLFDRVRLKGIPIPFHTRFEEVNLRFYVKRVMGDGSVRRGVVFVSEIVPLPAITLVARALYGEAYSTAKTRSTWRQHDGIQDIRYEWQHEGAWQHVWVEADAELRGIEAGSVEEFITEHYWGYTQHRGLIPRKGATGEYGVAHPRWEIYPVYGNEVKADFGSLYGEAFAGLTGRVPDHVLLAEGSAVAIRSGGGFTA
jgi:uncharacterized protein YqjF (DUF2071 family)